MYLNKNHMWTRELALAFSYYFEEKIIENENAQKKDYKSSISSKRPPRLFEIISSFSEEEFDFFEDLSNTFKTRFLRIEDKELEANLLDSLTGLYGHGAREKDLISFMDFAFRHNQPLSYLAFDLDKFKSINDTYGHPIGDKVLKGVSKIILENIRDEDNAYRQGGEELSILLPATEIEKAKFVAEKLRGAIEESVLIVKKRVSGNELKYDYDVVVGKEKVSSYRDSGLDVRYITTSVGVSTYYPSLNAGKKLRDNISELIARGDVALYKAKNSGRNRVEMYKS